jgi:hypothetical protein
MTFGNVREERGSEMPVEISEIGIRMRVDDDKGRERGSDRLGETERDAQREAIIDECVRRVLQALKARQER